MGGQMGTALLYSVIALSIVFFILGGMTVVIYTMRLIGGDNTSGDSGASGASKGAEPAKSAPAAPAKSSSAANVKAHHVAAITAAILAMTQGGGRIRSITPAGGNLRKSASDGTQRWRTAGILEGNSRRLEPAWKR